MALGRRRLNSLPTRPMRGPDSLLQPITLKFEHSVGTQSPFFFRFFDSPPAKFPQFHFKMTQVTDGRRLSAGLNPTPSAHRATISSTKPDPTMSAFKDIRFQAKAMAASLDSSDFSLLRSNTRIDRLRANPRGDLNQKSRKSEKKKALEEKSKENPDGYQWNHKKPVASVTSFVGGRRRSSFGGSVVELADIFAGSGVKVLSADMPPFMQVHAVDCARKTHDSMEKFTSKTLASTIKKEFDKDYGPAWHCIVGKSFGSFVTYSGGGFLYFSMDQKLCVLLFKTTVQRVA